MPKELSETIERGPDAEVRASGVERASPAAKQAIQGQVWKSRDAKWRKLDGEGKQEVGK